jgi:hypothetical protein
VAPVSIEYKLPILNEISPSSSNPARSDLVDVAVPDESYWKDEVPPEDVIIPPHGLYSDIDEPLLTPIYTEPIFTEAPTSCVDNTWAFAVGVETSLHLISKFILPFATVLQ